MIAPHVANVQIATGGMRNWILNLHAALSGTGVYAAHVAIAAYIGQGGHDSQPQTIADAYWRLHTGRTEAELVIVEIYFSVVQRKVVSPNDFADLTEVADRLRAFEDRYNATAQPFQWKFTASDLDDLLARLDRHTTDHREESSVALAA
ncbi:hypothetical protein [Streptomyces melanosporofaciens]|uniref:hypothetical protein n=1 Tax=Streptomyces melanosporofaciens TaxID=67327 RepID=UPI000A8466CF|nr:hypothetical protein [Streptomyces melanosporofaciens]